MLALLLAAATAQSCLALPGEAGEAAVTLEGRLSVHAFPGPPDYEDLGHGDRPERTYILTLARPLCLDDRGNFVAPNQRFSRVHLYAGGDALRSRLRAALGHRVRVRGTGFAAHTGHHHAPLVVRLRELRIMGR
jgi:hypothetical protein